VAPPIPEFLLSLKFRVAPPAQDDGAVIHYRMDGKYSWSQVGLDKVDPFFR
jgi:hypothetical protein